MSGLKYTRDHEWVVVEGDTATVGISNYAQEQLGDVVFVELPQVDTAVETGAEAAVVESVRRPARSTPPSAARSSRSTTRCRITRGWSTKTPRAKAGS